jgi:hypothetical protein
MCACMCNVYPTYPHTHAQAASFSGGLLGAALLPHRALNTSENETGVLYALQEDGVHTYRSKVPRKIREYDSRYVGVSE